MVSNDDKSHPHSLWKHGESKMKEKEHCLHPTFH
jgi:hypothetical protein